MLGGIVEDYFREFLDGRNPSALILTPRPTETLQQWKAMFEHEMFSGFTVREKDDINTPPDQPGPVITIASKQAMDALQRHNENYTSEVLMKYDIIAFDEAHEGAGTYLNRDTMCRHR
jgi:superfamily II DNA or RNA helicase